MPAQGRPKDPLRTAVAAQGVELSALFFVAFEELSLPGDPPRRVRLTAPPGMTTRGGRLSRQHVTLVPEEGHDAPAIVAGWADLARRRVELRSWQALDEAHRDRHRGARLGLAVSAYRHFLSRARGFFREQGFSVVVVDYAAHKPAGPRRQVAWGYWALVMGIALLLGVAIGGGLVLLVPP